MSVVHDLENIHSVQFGTENGYRDDVGLGVKGVPQQFSDACEWLGWARKSIKLVGVNLNDEALGHRGDDAWPAAHILTPRTHGCRTSRYGRSRQRHAELPR